MPILAQIPQDGLEAYYPFNGDTQDESINSYHATSMGTTFTQDRIGESGHALHLDATDQLTLPLQNLTPFSGDFAISIWFKTPNQIRSHLIELGYWLGGDGDGGNFQITLVSGGTLWAYWNGLGENALISQQVVHLNDNRWHHMVISRSSDVMSLYVDKVLLTMMPWSTATYTGDIGDDEPIIIGNTENPYRGEVDDIAIYSSGIDMQEVEQLYHDQQKLMVISPAITDRYPKQTTCKFEWKCSTAITSLDLEFSLDGGNSWINIANDVNTSVNYYLWQLPDWPSGTSVHTRISDSNDANNIFEVGPFYISEYHWEEVNSNCEWLPRDGAGLLVFQDKMWLLGGWNPFVEAWMPGNTCSEIWNSTDGQTWNFVGDAPWQGRHTAGWLVHDDMLWIIGGDWNSGVQQMDVWNSIDGITWNQVLDTLPMEARMTHMVASLGDEMIYFGGQTLTFLDFVGAELYNDVWSSHDGINWTEKTNHAGWHPRGQVEGQFVRNDTLWLIGGGTYDARYMYSDVWNTTDGINWTMVAESADFTPRQYHEVGIFDNRLWILGGYEGINNRNDVWYSDNGAEWFELKNTPWPPRHAGAVCTYDSSLWMVSGNLWNDSWRMFKENTIVDRVENHEVSTIQIWPNPTNDILHINASLGTIHRLYDLSGRVVAEWKQLTHTSQKNLSEFVDGIYILESDSVEVSRIVVVH
ncbi:MAG: T9SS type A sorting domain-containing protein [Flavobacteriales bacterium]|nr:T9SS type A sorting domain-containing protein [Flavobacteriales bacterium]